MLVKTFGSAIYGLEAFTVTVEVNVTEGLHTFVVGLPDNAIRESVRRVESALKNNGFFMPRTKLVINLVPANLRKSGSAFDLPIAIGILGATGQIPETGMTGEYMMMGELGLDGQVHPFRGALPMAIQAAREQFRGFILPAENAGEVSIVEELTVYGVSHLSQVVELLQGRSGIAPSSPAGTIRETPVSDLDFQDVRGQESIKRALEVAAAGGHNAVLIGPPGAGKTMLARRLPTILPPLSREESLETTRIHSIAGKLDNSPFISQRPFRSPHHTISAMALVGGGSIPKPGEISLAHNGILYLDELPEFQRGVLEVLRQPMEEGRVTISRARLSTDFPARFMLLASMNPCPCGYFNHPEKECVCPPGAVFKYINRISGPLMDRIDLHLEMVPVPYSELSRKREGPSSQVIRARVTAARQRQEARFRQHTPSGTTAISFNAGMSSRMVQTICRIDPGGERLLQAAMNKLHLSARAYERILKVSRTIADLAASEDIRPEHLAEAIQYRSLDREAWAA